MIRRPERPQADSGGMDQRLLLQVWDGTMTTRGAPDYDEANWDTAATIWGQVETLGGNELETAKKLTAIATTRITVHRYTSDDYTPTSVKRFKHKTTGQIYYIGHVTDPNEARAKRVCTCGETRP